MWTPPILQMELQGLVMLGKAQYTPGQSKAQVTPVAICALREMYMAVPSRTLLGASQGAQVPLGL